MSIFKTRVVEVAGCRWCLTEISAQQRLDFLERCTGFDPKNGFELLRNNIALSADLLALHQRRWYWPQGWLRWRARRLPDPVLAELFNHCVQLSNLPFVAKQEQPDDQPLTGDLEDD
jgi:hypothetical protein